MFEFEINIQNPFPFFVEIEYDGLLIAYSLYICDGQSDSLKLKYTYKCKRMSSIGILLTYTTYYIALHTYIIFCGEKM